MLGCGEIAIWLICNTVMQVYPSPTIAVLSTGDELVEPTTANLGRGQVLNCSRITYHAPTWTRDEDTDTRHGI